MDRDNMNSRDDQSTSRSGSQRRIPFIEEEPGGCRVMITHGSNEDANGPMPIINDGAADCSGMITCDNNAGGPDLMSVPHAPSPVSSFLHGHMYGVPQVIARSTRATGNAITGFQHNGIDHDEVPNVEASGPVPRQIVPDMVNGFHHYMHDSSVTASNIQTVATPNGSQTFPISRGFQPVMWSCDGDVQITRPNIEVGGNNIDQASSIENVRSSVVNVPALFHPSVGQNLGASNIALSSDQAQRTLDGSFLSLGIGGELGPSFGGSGFSNSTDYMRRQVGANRIPGHQWNREANTLVMNPHLISHGRQYISPALVADISSQAVIPNRGRLSSNATPFTPLSGFHPSPGQLSNQAIYPLSGQHWVTGGPLLSAHPVAGQLHNISAQSIGRFPSESSASTSVAVTGSTPWRDQLGQAMDLGMQNATSQMLGVPRTTSFKRPAADLTTTTSQVLQKRTRTIRPSPTPSLPNVSLPFRPSPQASPYHPSQFGTPRSAPLVPTTASLMPFSKTPPSVMPHSAPSPPPVPLSASSGRPIPYSALLRPRLHPAVSVRMPGIHNARPAAVLVSPQTKPSVKHAPAHHIKWQGEKDTPHLIGEKCFLCKRDLSFTPEGPVSQPDKPPDVAILPCGHTFHDHCLHQITPPDQVTNPPCIPCALGDSGGD